jgi:hypothetical protein
MLIVELFNNLQEKKKITAKNDPCWKGYHMVGTKKKSNQEVPNCVPGAKEMDENWATTNLVQTNEKAGHKAK